MNLIETWRETTIREGFGRRLSPGQIAQETGLSVREVLRRALKLKLLSPREAAFLAPSPHNRRKVA
jgi:hypothetical protein